MVLISNNATVVAYIKRQGGTVSQVMCNLAKDILFWAEQLLVFLTVKYILGKKNILGNQLNHLNQVLLMEW